jgi:hypothetical protein
MIEYADYEFYMNKYKGSLSSDLFHFYIGKASMEIQNNVNKKLTKEDLKGENGYKIKYTTCMLIDYLKTEKNSNVKSISIDGVSKTIKTLEETKKDKEKIFDYLPQELTRYI